MANKKDPGFAADVLTHGPHEARELLRQRGCITAYDAAYASAIEAGHDHDASMALAAQASQHDAR